MTVNRTERESSLKQLLEERDWAFPSARTQEGTHGIHPYPAKFIPQIPRELIRLLTPPPDTSVLDPFCGSGTTLAEAQAAGYPAIGVDLNPIATLISSVKTCPPEGPAGPTAEGIVVQCRRGQPAEIPKIPRVNHWFAHDVQQALANLVSEIKQVDDVPLQNALRVALSSIVVRVSNQDSDTRYAAVSKRVSADLVYDLFRRAATTIDAAHDAQFGGLFGRKAPPVDVITADVLKLDPLSIKAPIGLVVTSPPYPNAYEYWLYHKYRMYWLGMDPIAVRESEIGARAHFFKKNHHTEEDFGRQMAKVFELLKRTVVSGGNVCVLVGRSVIHGREIDNAGLVHRAATTHGFNPVGHVVRPIRAQRKAFNLSHARIKSESILVFQHS